MADEKDGKTELVSWEQKYFDLQTDFNAFRRNNMIDFQEKYAREYRPLVMEAERKIAVLKETQAFIDAKKYEAAGFISLKDKEKEIDSGFKHLREEQDKITKKKRELDLRSDLAGYAQLFKAQREEINELNEKLKDLQDTEKTNETLQYDYNILEEETKKLRLLSIETKDLVDSMKNIYEFFYKK